MQEQIDAALARARSDGTPQSVRGSLSWHSPLADATCTADVSYTLGTQQRQVEIDGLAVDLAAPIALEGLPIPKPWGQEIWFSGMEARGESQVRVGGRRLPLPAYLALAPRWLTGGQVPILLKILDPDPRPVRGDLYLEVHEEKRESYVVTHLDPGAWPDGVGAIRYGVDQARRAAAGSDAAFRAHFLEAIQAYERVRRLLDEEAVDLHEDPVLAGASRSDLPAIERSRRAAMDAFTTLVPLRVGDIVQVPPWHPHALQHGVRVVEFQTPTYERYIISFAQRVLTQPHWDSERALADLSLEPRPLVMDEADNADLATTRVARYDHFGALRLKLCTARPYRIPAALPYLVGYCIDGQAGCGDLALSPGEAFFVPGTAIAAGASLHGDDASILIAAPGL
ncbi:MAG: hypothetical protein AAGI15_00205 [Pseudomonadota bacterium]